MLLVTFEIGMLLGMLLLAGCCKLAIIFWFEQPGRSYPRKWFNEYLQRLVSR